MIASKLYRYLDLYEEDENFLIFELPKENRTLEVYLKCGLQGDEWLFRVDKSFSSVHNDSGIFKLDGGYRTTDLIELQLLAYCHYVNTHKINKGYNALSTLKDNAELLGWRKEGQVRV